RPRGRGDRRPVRPAPGGRLRADGAVRSPGSSTAACGLRTGGPGQDERVASGGRAMRTAARIGTALILASLLVPAGRPITPPSAHAAEPVRTGKAEPDHSRVPRVVIAHSPAASRQYIGSPGLAV